MLVTPLPATDRRNLRDALRDAHSAVSNIWSGGSRGAQGWLAEYLEWATDTLTRLGSQISAADLERLVLTPGYARLLSAFGTMTATDNATQRVLNGMVRLELTQRVDAFAEAVKDLEHQIGRWAQLGEFTVADTSFFIEHPDKLEDADFRPLLNTGADPVRLLVPIVVVDELDGLKKSKTTRERWRARYTLAVIDRVLASPAEPGLLNPESLPAASPGSVPRGAVTLELVFDPPGHVRLPINDDEIIDRALAIQPLAARNITLLTYDTGQGTRARNAGLKAVRLTSPPDSETDAPGSTGKASAAAGREIPRRSSSPSTRAATRTG
jgi:hypothetical protein